MGRLANSIATLAAAVTCGWVCSLTGIPLGWLIGAMLAMIVASLAGWQAVQPTLVVPYVKASVGTMLGASLGMPVFAMVAGWWPSLVWMFVIMAISGGLNFALLQRLFRFAPVDAALCAVPGGITEMILLGDNAGADARRVAIVHAIRIAASILCVPVLAHMLFGTGTPPVPTGHDTVMSAGDWMWFGLCVLVGVAADRWTRLPAPFILAPLVVSGALHLTGVSLFDVPPVVSKAVQVVIGMNVGARFLGLSAKALAQVGGAAMSVVCVQMAFAVIAALGLSSVAGWDGLALLLAYAPGGLAEMSLIAVAMGREVAFVGFHHILRVLFALSVAPALIHRLRRHSR